MTDPAGSANPPQQQLSKCAYHMQINHVLLLSSSHPFLSGLVPPYKSSLLPYPWRTSSAYSDALFNSVENIPGVAYLGQQVLPDYMCSPPSSLEEFINHLSQSSVKSAKHSTTVEQCTDTPLQDLFVLLPNYQFLHKVCFIFYATTTIASSDHLPCGIKHVII